MRHVIAANDEESRTSGRGLRVVVQRLEVVGNRIAHPSHVPEGVTDALIAHAHIVGADHIARVECEQHLRDLHFALGGLQRFLRVQVVGGDLRQNRFDDLFRMQGHPVAGPPHQHLVGEVQGVHAAAPRLIVAP